MINTLYLYEFTIDGSYFVQVRAESDKKAFDLLLFALSSDWTTISMVKY